MFASRSPHRLVGVAAMLLIGVLVFHTTWRELAAAPPAKKTVTLVVDYGDGVQKHFRTIPWKAEMTVLDAMQAAQRHRRGIKYEYRGKSSTALLTKIDDLENAGGKGKNWLFRVNGKLGDRSFAIFRLKPADTVLWKFATYRNN